jgi:hypothetical protein
MAKVKANPMDKFKEKTSDVKPSSFVTESLIKSEIIILPELKDLIPALAEDESRQLEENLIKYGIKDPLSVWETDAITVLNGLEANSPSHDLFADLDNDTTVYILFDGHNRYGIAKDRNLDFKVNKMTFNGLSEVKDYMIDYQLGRRNLTPEQVSYLRGLKYNELKKAGKASGKSVKEKINVAEELAQEFGVTDRTIKRDGEFAEGMDKLTPEFKKDVLSGKSKLAKKDVQALKSAKPSAPIDSMAGVLELLKEQEIEKDHQSEQKVDELVDRAFSGYDLNNDESEGSVNTAQTDLNQLDAFNLDEFKGDLQESPAIENSADSESTEMYETEPVLTVEEVEGDLKQLFEQHLSKDVLIQIINKAGELLNLRD